MTARETNHVSPFQGWIESKLYDPGLRAFRAYPGLECFGLSGQYSILV